MSSIAGTSLRYISRNLTRQFHALPFRAFSANASLGDSIDDNESKNTHESNDDFLPKIFGGLSGISASTNDPFLKKIGKLERGFNKRKGDDLNESFNSLNDGIDGKLRNASMHFNFGPEESSWPYYSSRPGMQSNRANRTSKDVDQRKPGVTRRYIPPYSGVTTKEVLMKADFRNVRFLAKFITEAGIIHKRSTIGIKAKAQRKLAREIKTARAFGLLPFTTMGTKAFAYGRSMENLETDFTYQTYNNSAVRDEYADVDSLYDDPPTKYE